MFDFELVKGNLTKQGYEYKQFLGSSGFSCVLLCQSQNLKKDIAVKRIMKHRMTDDEFNSLVSLNHPYIAKYYESFGDRTAQYLVMEYCSNGTIQQKGRLSYEKFIFYAKQMLEAIAYCHSNKIAHNYISPRNIFIDKYDNIKIADFEMVKKTEFNHKSNEKFNELIFQPPEMLLSDEYCPFKADIWALGITFFFMATGNYPFQSDDIEELKLKMLKREFNFFKYKIHPKIRFLINKMTAINQYSRSSAEDLLKLPIFSTNYSRSLVTLGTQNCGKKSKLKLQNPNFMMNFKNKSHQVANNSRKRVTFNPQIEFNETI